MCEYFLSSEIFIFCERTCILGYYDLKNVWQCRIGWDYLWQVIWSTDRNSNLKIIFMILEEFLLGMAAEVESLVNEIY